MNDLGATEFSCRCWKGRAGAVCLLTIFGCLLTMQTARAELLGHDSFNYGDGEVLDGLVGGTGFDGPWFSEPVVTSADRTLAFGGQTGAPKAALINGADFLTVMNRPFETVEDTLYVGMLLRAEVWDDDFMQLTVSDGETGNARASMTVGIDGRNPVGFYARTGTSGEGSSFSESAEFAIETDYFLVGKFSKDGVDTYNRVDLFVNPGDTEPETADAIRVDIDSQLEQLSLFSVRTALMEGDEEIYLDELRVGTSFSDVLLSGVELPDPGDFNNDGRITLDDFAIMKANFKEPGGFAEGDITFDGVVDLEDFREFVPLFAAANPGQALVVPEPSSLWLAMSSMLLPLSFRRRRFTA